MHRFHNRVRQILMASGSTTFTKVMDTPTGIYHIVEHKFLWAEYWAPNFAVLLKF